MLYRAFGRMRPLLALPLLLLLAPSARAGGPLQVAPSLVRLTVPVLVIVGSEDRESLGPSAELAERLPNAELRVIAEAGHVVNLAKPREFNAAVEQFLREKVGLRLSLRGPSEPGRDKGEV